MTILDLLAKLGILRYGAKSAVYTSGKDRPAEFMMEGVLNAERDLIANKEPKTPPVAGDGGKAEGKK